jgi:hypothetical protein
MRYATLTTQAMPRKSDALPRSLDRIAKVLAADFPGHERQWAKIVDSALVFVEAALRQQRDLANDPDGLLAGVDEMRPTLARRAEQLRSDYDHFLTRVLSLREEVQKAVEAFQPAPVPLTRTCVGKVADFGAIKQGTLRLKEELRRHQEAELRLVMDSVNTDIGAGD